MSFSLFFVSVAFSRPPSLGQACGVNKVVSIEVRQDLGSFPGWTVKSYMHLGGKPKIIWTLFLICEIGTLMPAPQVYY